MSLWNTEPINQARCASFAKVLAFICADHKVERKNKALDLVWKSVRVQVGHQYRDFRLSLVGEKLINELLPEVATNRGSRGGAS
ncbi:hypothetical protein NT239_05855 [Chitinibacter sp. SCUT-21]|uniref:hypothetical protein n=1 Tax=Chitinibacter sp. SCUT-21 TaxID=2970891 RepID=UPI0035A6634F